MIILKRMSKVQSPYMDDETVQLCNSFLTLGNPGKPQCLPHTQLEKLMLALDLRVIHPFLKLFIDRK